MADGLNLLDDDGENLALRSFLMQYSCDRAVTVGWMREHMEMCGWGPDYWPEFAKRYPSPAGAHLTKAGAQLWIRHLLGMEHATPPAPSTAPSDELPLLEQAARICDELHYNWKWDDEPDSSSGPRECAAAIRALANKKGT